MVYAKDMMTHNEISRGAINYTDYVIGLDPIGAGDLRSDFYLFVMGQEAAGNFTDFPEAWAVFNEQIVKPVYRLDIPAVPNPEIV